MARGGSRQGAPGRSYSNRSDLNTSRAPSAGTATPAAGGIRAPGPAPSPVAFTGPDQVPKLDDPSAYPDEPLTAGLASGPGPGPEILGPMGVTDPAVQRIQAAYLAYPTPELARVLDIMKRKGSL